MRVIGLFLLAGLAMADAPTYQEIATTGQLMQGLIQPSAAAIQEAAKDQGPQDNRAWRSAMLNGIMLQEAGQLLMIGGRAKDQDGWVTNCRAMMNAGAAVQKAAQAKDVAALQSAAGSINGTCQGCHSVYRQRRDARK